jgi:hypothetical protein
MEKARKWDKEARWGSGQVVWWSSGPVADEFLPVKKHKVLFLYDSYMSYMVQNMVALRK